MEQIAGLAPPCGQASTWRTPGLPVSTICLLKGRGLRSIVWAAPAFGSVVVAFAKPALLHRADARRVSRQLWLARTQITLTPSSLAAGYISRFPVGKWLMLGGLDTQGLWNSPYGFPPNQTFFEWRQVAAVDTLTGVITLDRPLGNTYLSTWPNYNQGNNFEADNGGPATIWAVHDTWNATVEYRGLTINQEGQTYSPARHVTYRGVTFGGGHGGIPTQNETWSAINTSFANVNLEIDKLIGTMTMDGVTIKQIVFQSSSTDLFVMKNSTVTNRLDGGGKRTEITDSKLNNFGPGIWAYGGTNGATICTRCNIATFNFDFGIFQNDNPSPYSMSGGVISFPNTAATGYGPAQRCLCDGLFAPRVLHRSSRRAEDCGAADIII